MSNGFMGPEGYGPDPFGEFLSRFFGRAAASGSGEPGQPMPRQADIARLMSGPARDLVTSAAAYAAEHGSPELGTEHLLRAALSAEPTRTLLQQAGADPDALAEEIDRSAGEGPKQSSVAVTPAVKRALLGAHELARDNGASYIGPEHVLDALAANPDSAAGRILNLAHFDPQAAAQGGHGHGPQHGEPSTPPRPSTTPPPSTSTAAI